MKKPKNESNTAVADAVEQTNEVSNEAEAPVEATTTNEAPAEPTSTNEAPAEAPAAEAAAPAATEPKAPKVEKPIVCPNCQHEFLLSSIRKANGGGGRTADFSKIVLLGTDAERAEKLKGKAPQLVTLINALSKVGKSELSADEATSAINGAKDDLRTRQEPMRIFKYYRKAISELGVVQFS